MKTIELSFDTAFVACVEEYYQGCPLPADHPRFAPPPMECQRAAVRACLAQHQLRRPRYDLIGKIAPPGTAEGASNSPDVTPSWVWPAVGAMAIIGATILAFRSGTI